MSQRRDETSNVLYKKKSIICSRLGEEEKHPGYLVENSLEAICKDSSVHVDTVWRW